jgi:hypothetical protein
MVDGYVQGLGSMAPARVPGPRANPTMEITAPMYGPDAPPPAGDIGESPLMEAPEQTELGKLLGQFYAEIDMADQARQPKEQKWIKIDKYLAGEDVQDAPEDYQESTFFYRRLPRIIQIGKAKLFKHVCPLHGRPWEVKPSPRGYGDKPQAEVDTSLRKLRLEIEDIHDAMEMENMSDDMCEFLASRGSAVAFGPIQLSQPRMRWQDGVETLDPADTNKPMWKLYDPITVYPDPNGKKAQDMEYVYFRHVLSGHQIRTLEEDDTFIAAELGTLLSDMPDGNWASEVKDWETAPSATNLNSSNMNRYVTWMRVGMLTAEALEALGEKVPKDDRSDNKRVMTESQWEIWFCGQHILKISKRKFQPKKMPISFIPFRRDPTSAFGIGAGESALEVVEMLVNITRSIDDALTDTSGYQVMLDAGAVENKDLTVRGRKTWIYRNKANGRKEGPSGRPVEFFAVPSNLPHLLECFSLFESMLPICTGIPEMMTGLDMGSGVRTDNMANDVWASLEEFLKDVVGNVDRYWWKPHLRDTYQWIQTYYQDRKDLQVDATMEVQGVRGALRRELVGRKVKDFYATMHQFGLPDWFDEIELAKTVAEGIGIETEKAVLSPEKYVERQQLMAKKKELEIAAGQAPVSAAQEKERAHTSARDAMLETFKSFMTADPHNPNTIPIMERIYKLTGQLDPKAEAALSVWSRLLAAEFARLQVITAQESAILTAPVEANTPSEEAPGANTSPAADAEKIRQQGAANVPNDTELVHVTPGEKQRMLDEGGSGEIDPQTGLMHLDDQDPDSGNYGDQSGDPTGSSGDWKGAQDTNTRRAASYGQDYMGDQYTHGQDPLSPEGVKAAPGPERIIDPNDPRFKNAKNTFDYSQPGSYVMNPHGVWSRIGRGFKGVGQLTQTLGTLVSGSPMGLLKAPGQIQKAGGNLAYAFSDRDYVTTGQTPDVNGTPTSPSGQPTDMASSRGSDAYAVPAIQPMPANWAPNFPLAQRESMWRQYIKSKGTLT